MSPQAKFLANSAAQVPPARSCPGPLPSVPRAQEVPPPHRARAPARPETASGSVCSSPGPSLTQGCVGVLYGHWAVAPRLRDSQAVPRLQARQPRSHFGRPGRGWEGRSWARPKEATEGGEKRGNLGRKRARGGTGAGPGGGGGTLPNHGLNTVDWRG